jgi:hypothetical protein
MTRANPFETADDPWEATTAEANPFDDDEPLFDTQRDTFPNVEWVIGRLLLIWPTEFMAEGILGDSGNRFYPMVCRIAVLDGETTDNLPKIPMEIEPFRFNAESIARDLKHLLGKNRPKLARIAEKPSKKNKSVMARFLAAPDDADIALATKYMKSHR